MFGLPFATNQRPIAYFLNALVLASLLPGIIGVVIFNLAEYRQERQHLTREMLQTSRMVGQAIDTHLLRTQALAQWLASSDELAPDHSSAFLQHSNRSLAMVGLGGKIALLEVGEKPAAPFISDVVTDLASGQNTIHIQVPVMRPGVRHQALSMTIPVQQLNQILQRQHLPAGMLLSLLDRQGVVAGRNMDANMFVGRPTIAIMRAGIAGRDAGSVDNVMRDGVPHFTAFSRSPATGYTTVVGVPRSQFIGPLRSKLAYLTTLISLLFGLGLLLARYMSRQISESIHALIAPAIALGQGIPLSIKPVQLSETAEVGAAMERAAALLQQRDAALQAQQAELQQFKFFSENANEILLLLDVDGNIRYGNRMASSRIGYSNAELRSMTLFQIDLASRPESLRVIFNRCRLEQPPPFERVYRCKDGSSFPVEITATVLEHQGEWLMHVAPRDITERQHAEQAVRWAASHDGLTGMANRATALAFLQQSLLEASEGGAGDGALLYIDLNRFKPVNDIYGHEVGDRVLQEVARRLQPCVDQRALLARVGGDEFVAILCDLTEDTRQASEVADAMIQAVSQPIRVGKIEVLLSACIGISRFPENGDNASALVHAADLAMLQVKHRGRAAHAFYIPEMDTQAQFTLSVERRLQQAIEHGGFSLHYQPIINLANNTVEGMEALVRLADGIEPALGPATFIPIAESCGLIAPLGDWVAREACRQQVQWQAQGIALTVSVNFSALQFQRANFSQHIRELITFFGIDPCCLVIELTETAVMDNQAEAVDIMRELKALGVRIALDDFGTGYSSLSRLSTLPIDKLKIDQSFVRRIETDHASRAVIDAIIALGHSLGVELVAEGIETEAAMHYLRERGCQLGQGYYFSRPMPAAEFVPWRQRHAAALPEVTFGP